MKVKCINNKDENSNIIEGLQVGKVYEVFTYDESKYFQVYQEEESITTKTLRDEFAMAAINAIGHQYDCRKIVEYKALAESVYEIADAMLEVRNENEK